MTGWKWKSLFLLFKCFCICTCTPAWMCERMERILPVHINSCRKINSYSSRSWPSASETCRRHIDISSRRADPNGPPLLHCFINDMSSIGTTHTIIASTRRRAFPSQIGQDLAWLG